MTINFPMEDDEQDWEQMIMDALAEPGLAEGQTFDLIGFDEEGDEIEPIHPIDLLPHFEQVVQEFENNNEQPQFEHIADPDDMTDEDNVDLSDLPEHPPRLVRMNAEEIPEFLLYNDETGIFNNRPMM